MHEARDVPRLHVGMTIERSNILFTRIKSKVGTPKPPLPATAQTAPRTQLAVHLTTDRTSYRLTDNIQLDVARENAGTSGLFIYRRWEWGISKIRVFDSKGNELKDVAYPIDDPPPLRAADFILLEPGQLFATRVERRMNEFVKRPGEYEFVVEYIPYLSDDLARKYIERTDIPFWSRQRGAVRSNRIKIGITR